MPRNHPPETRDKAKTLFLQGIRPEKIASECAVNTATVHQWASKLGWTDLRLDIDQASARIREQAHNPLARASSKAQELFSQELTSQANLLRDTPAKRLSDLANTPRREGRASVVNRLVNTAAKLYGWDQQSSQPTHVSLTKIDVRTSTPTNDNGPVVDVPYE